MPRYDPPSDKEWDDAMKRVLGIVKGAVGKKTDFSDTLFLLSCGCILDGCSGAAGVDRFLSGEPMRMYCKTHKDVRLEQIVTVGDPS